MRKSRRRLLWIAGLVVLAAVLLLPASSLYYHASGGEGCAGCHEIRQSYELWRQSTHRFVSCSACHGDALTSGIEVEEANLRRLVTHARGTVPEQIRLKGLDLVRIMDRCRSCHRQEFAEWEAGPHGSKFPAIFLDAKYNRQKPLMDDCLRCHGAWFEGGIRDLVAPLNNKGPWKFLDEKLALQPVIPCFACHQIHRHGEPLHGTAQLRPHLSLAEEIERPSLAFFDRREMDHVPVSDLPLPVMLDRGRAVRMSPDQRQALCYACHAPLAAREIGSGDDRTGMGVHEGLSCLACHQKHGQTTRASCAGCHPRLSNCGLDVEKMDTTFRAAASKHNIHFVKCADCHTNGVPKRTAKRGGATIATVHF